MEKSCGFVAYKIIENKNYYLLIRGLNGDVGFPKGHVEGDETELETAKRELKEETNIEVKAIDGFRKEIEYKIPSKKNTLKQVVYFLGECVSDKIVCQLEEITDAGFFTFDDAYKIITFDDSRKILLEAEELINSKSRFEE